MPSLNSQPDAEATVETPTSPDLEPVPATPTLFKNLEQGVPVRIKPMDYTRRVITRGPVRIFRGDNLPLEVEKNVNCTIPAGIRTRVEALGTGVTMDLQSMRASNHREA